MKKLLVIAIVLALAGLAVPAERTFAWFCTNPHTVVRGEFMAQIAQNCGITLSALEAANPQIANPNLIFAGEQLTIPGGGTSVTSTPVTSTATPTAVPTVMITGTPGIPSTGSRTYTVRVGDTLWGISQRFGVTLLALQNANPQITNHRLIFPGQVVNVP